MKRKIIIFFVIVLIFGAIAYFLKSSRNDVTPSLTPAVSVEKPSVSTGGLSNYAGQVTTASVVDGSASNSQPPIDKMKVWYQEWPKSNFDITLDVFPIMLPAQMGNDVTGRTSLIRFVGLISNDMQQISALLKQENFVVREWNLFKQAIINDPHAPISWAVSFNGTNGTISGIRKQVFKDNSRKNEIRSEGYNLDFVPGGYVLERLARNDGSEHLLFFANGQIRVYGQRVEKVNWYGIRYDDTGKVISEKISKPSSQIISSHKKLIEKYKNDPNMGEGIRQLEAELQAIQTNK